MEGYMVMLLWELKNLPAHFQIHTHLDKCTLSSGHINFPASPDLIIDNSHKKIEKGNDTVPIVANISWSHDVQ